MLYATFSGNPTDDFLVWIKMGSFRSNQDILWRSYAMWDFMPKTKEI